MLNDRDRVRSTAVFFSKDRAMQLCAAIESFQLHCSDSELVELCVLYKASDERHFRQYDLLKERFGSVSFIEEVDFKKQLLETLGGFEFVLFVVDDNLFVRDFHLTSIFQNLRYNPTAVGFSLRLGTNTDYCYSHNVSQKLPVFQMLNNGALKYKWTEAEHDFGYPLEVSSSVYRITDILDIMRQLQFSNPNTLEASLAGSVMFYAQVQSRLLCFEHSIAFCNPVNKVQSTFSNRSGTEERYTPEKLAEMFDKGFRIDVSKYSDLIPNSCHQEIELYFVENNDQPTVMEQPSVPETFNTDTSDKCSQPEFSIVMANYNNGEYISQAIESVLDQKFSNWELIIIDDCSTDDSLAVINNYLSDERIRLIQHEQNRGYTQALKTGIANVCSDYFGILDSDDCLTPEAVEVMYGQHIRYRNCGFIYSQFMYCDSDLTPRKKGFCAEIPPGKTSLDANSVSHFKTFKMVDYQKTDGYDENILYAEDLDIIYKMEEVTDLKYVDDCLYFYRELPNSISRTMGKISVCIMSRVKARINALKRRCLSMAGADHRNFGSLFRDAIEQARVEHQDVEQYFILLRQMHDKGFFDSLDTPDILSYRSIDEQLLWLAANVDIEFDKLFAHLGEKDAVESNYYEERSEEKESNCIKTESVPVGNDIDLVPVDTVQFPAAPHQDMSSKPLISVYMVTYNGEKYIGQAIDSVLSQTYSNIELLIVDDGSTDGTARIIDSYSDSKIRYIQQEHKNFASGMNRAIREAAGDFIIGVDSDDFVASDYIEKMVACAILYPDVDYFYPRSLVLVNEAGDVTEEQWDYMDFPDSELLPAFIFSNAYGPIPNPGSLKRKSLFDRTGLYEELETVEDFVFLCRNALKIRFLRVDDHSTYYYRRHESGNSQKFQARDRIMADCLNEMVSIYPARMLCPQLAAWPDDISTNRQFIEFLANTFQSHAHRSSIKFGEYYRRYGDLYRYELIRLLREIGTVVPGSRL